MSFKLLGGGSDLPTVISDVNQNVLELKNRETTEIFKDDTGIRRVLLGKGADGFYGLKVSKPTFDVYTAGDDDLAFNSAQNVFKIVSTGTSDTQAVTATSSAGTWSIVTGSVTIPHNLGFIPIPMVFININNTYLPLPHTTTIGTGTNSTTWYTGTFSAATDATNLYIDVWLSVFGGVASYSALPIKYYLLQETAN